MDHWPGNHSAGLWHLWLNRASCLFGSRFSADSNGLPRRGDPLEAVESAEYWRLVLALILLWYINKQVASKYSYLHPVTELLMFLHYAKC